MEVLRAVVYVACAGLLIVAAWQVATGWRFARQRAIDFWRDPRGTFHRHLEELPFDYPPSVILTADLALWIAAMTAVLQRHDFLSTSVPLISLFVVTFAFPLLTIFGVSPRPVALCVVGLIAQGLFLLQPVPLDVSPFVLVVVAGEVAAIAPKRISLPFTAAAIGELLVFHFAGPYIDSLPNYIVGVILGTLVGLMMQYQRMYLGQERENQEILAGQAADDERRRIAREVHDVIAHSLSITLLHLTAARHALETDRDVDEAVDALVDAERLGRQAMADIRHTVGLLDQRPTRMTPEPSLDDIESLVADFVRAGLSVEYALTGDTEWVSATTGLALFRISQESLANIAKHAHGARVDLGIAVTETEVTVSVRNTLPGGTPAKRGRGMGISGMRQRVELLGGTLSAGPDDDCWQVRGRIPITTAKPGFGCGSTIPEDSLRLVREAVTSLTRKLQEGM
ncbi:sensor histidine kinase [Nocardia sp. NPDC051570]|uniref:sensor histidine kinase n=1 Tax=Nocardia sp. NPDC051570 TaxID=3364324 RepID=UPI0037A7A195